MQLETIIAHREADIGERFISAIYYVLMAGGSEYPLSRSSGRGRNGKQYWRLSGTGQRCRFSASTKEEALAKAYKKLDSIINH